jgi:methyltransferase (TIGR00027 family)
VAFFDHAVDRFLADITQFVVLGAGFDTRAFRLPKGARVRSFEVDAPQTQVVKREALRKAGIDTTGVTFVSADLEKEDWLTRLVDAGFDPGKPALFLWEGVIVYLDREAVEATLHKIASVAKGSVVAFDYFTTEPLVRALSIGATRERGPAHAGARDGRQARLGRLRNRNREMSAASAAPMLATEAQGGAVARPQQRDGCFRPEV